MIHLLTKRSLRTPAYGLDGLDGRPAAWLLRPTGPTIGVWSLTAIVAAAFYCQANEYFSGARPGLASSFLWALGEIAPIASLVGLMTWLGARTLAQRPGAFPFVAAVGAPLMLMAFTVGDLINMAARASPRDALESLYANAPSAFTAWLAATFWILIKRPQPPQSAMGNGAAGAGKYLRSGLASDEAERILGKIQSEVIGRDRHLDPNLNLGKLARLVGTNPNYVSQALNTTGEGFHGWLARVRVETVLQRLSDAPLETNMLQLGLEVGFNSKSTFYEAFKKVTGLPPGAWLRAQNQGSAIAAQ